MLFRIKMIQKPKKQYFSFRNKHGVTSTELYDFVVYHKYIDARNLGSPLLSGGLTTPYRAYSQEEAFKIGVKKLNNGEGDSPF